MSEFFYSEVRYPGVGLMESYCRSDEMLSVSQAAARLNVHRQTVYRLVDDGILAARRRGSGGGRITIPREDVDDYNARVRGVAA